MTIQQMRYVMAVLEAGSISEGAKQLYIAQSSVSSAIKELEQELGFEVFSRKSKGVVLTRKGEDYVLDIKSILEKIDMVEHKYTLPPQHGFEFSVSTQHHLPGIDAFCKLLQGVDSPLVHASFLELRTSDILTFVANGKCDVGIIFLTKHSKDFMIKKLRRLDLIFNHITYHPVHIYVHNSNPLSKLETLLSTDLDAYPRISYDRSIDSESIFTDIPSMPPSKVIHVTDRASAYELMESLGGYIIGSGYRTASERQHGISAIPILDSPHWEIGWLCKAKMAESATTKLFLAELLEQMQVNSPL